MIEYKIDRAGSIDLLNSYWDNNEPFQIYAMKGVPPTAEEARDINFDSRPEDVLGYAHYCLFRTGNLVTPVNFTPTQDGLITWVKIYKYSGHENMVLTTDHVGIEGTNNHIWFKTLNCVVGTPNTVVQAYLHFDLA